MGATNREIRRRARLADQDQLISRTADLERRLLAEFDRAGALLEDFRRARIDLPSAAPLARATEAVSAQGALRARARDELESAGKAPDAAAADADAKRSPLRQAAPPPRMPTEAGQRRANARAAPAYQ